MDASEGSGIRRMEKYKRPTVLEGHTSKREIGCGNAYITVNHTPEGKIIEVFAAVGKSGTCTKAQLEALTRSITLGLRYGVPLEAYVKQLKDIRCPTPLVDKGVEFFSCADAIAKILQEEIDSSSKDSKVT